MEQSNQSKKVLLSVIGVAILVVAVVGVSFAFFNYTRSGPENNIQSGRISFTSSQDGDIQITNFFPAMPGESTETSDSAVITVTGQTDFAAGIDFRISTDGVSYTSTNVPISVLVTPDFTADTDITTVSNSYSSATTLPNNGGVLMTGHIAGDGDSHTGTVTVAASISLDVAITDTYIGDTAPTGYQNGTTDAWVGERTRITTAQWNALADNPITFRLKVEAKETGGAYVGEARSS